MTETKLYRCRFCGHYPKMIVLFNTTPAFGCPNCENWVCAYPDHEKTWQARNEKNNPFIENKQ